MDVPQSRAFAASARFTTIEPTRPVRVLVAGQWLPADLVATNGPRSQVLIEQEGGRYRRWVDAADVQETGET